MIETSNYLVERINKFSSLDKNTNEGNNFPNKFQKNVLMSFTIWLEEKNLSPSTVHTYTKLIKKHQDLSSRFFNITNLQTLFRRRLNRYEPATLHLELSALTCFAKFRKIEMEWEEVAKLLPHRTQKFFSTINPSELKQLKQARYEKNDWIYQRNNLIFDFMFYTGVRIGELVNIKHSDWENNSFKVLGKGNKIRYIFVPNFLVSQLSLNSSNNYLFTTTKGKGLDTCSIEKFITRRTKLAGIKKAISPHTFRRSFATFFNNRKVKLTTIQKLLGHNKLETTANYIHNSHEELYADYSKAWKGEEQIIKEKEVFKN